MHESREQPPQPAPSDMPSGTSSRPGRPVGPRWHPTLTLLMLLFVGFTAWSFFSQPQEPAISYTRFKEALRAGQIERLEAKGETLTGRFKQGQSVDVRPGAAEGRTNVITTFQTMLPPFGDKELTEAIQAQGVELVSHGSGSATLGMVLLNLLPFLLLVGFLIFMARRVSSQAGGLSSIGRSPAKAFKKERSNVAFDQVAGLKEAKEGLKEIITFLKTPERFTRLGCRVPKGVLLVGPPGTGKTLLARAVAGEAEVPFYSVTGSDFMEMFVGVGASRVRDLFATAKRNSPCIMFVDELDSVGRHRGAGVGGGHDEREQTLNQLLSEIDGFEPTDNVVVIAATNRPDVLDPALLRTGRFDRRVVVDLPTLPERVEILKVHTQRIPLGQDVNLEEIARSMPRRSGADLSNLVNEAALLAAKSGKTQVERDEFSQARDQILMGHTRGSLVLERSEKHAVAVHEAGHALVAHLTPEADPVEKVSIIPRGQALGATQQLGEERYNVTVEYLRALIKVMLGGRASEEVLLESVSTGASDDLQRATQLARRMVEQWGMSERFKNVAFGESDGEVFLGEQIGRRRHHSEATAREIDQEIRSLINECYQEATTLLRQHRALLEQMAEALEASESLEGERLAEILGERGGPVRRLAV